jgi:hypothetical protein
MDTELLVGARIEDGKRLIDQLIEDGFEVSVAFWANLLGESFWRLYIASPLVDPKRPGEAYPRIFSALNKLGPTSLQISEIRIMDDQNLVAIEVRGTRDRYETRDWRGVSFGGMIVNDIYIYTRIVPIRLAFHVSYTRSGDSNQWDAVTELGERLEGVKAKGAVGYSTALWEGESPKDVKHGIVGVLVEIPPEWSNHPFLDNPQIAGMFADQARTLADEMFRKYHSDAVIEHDEGLKFSKRARR